MDVITRRPSSSLNPNAPLFVPCAYRAVEDFSDQWWELVNTSSWFRDYWLQECFQDPQNDPDFSQNDDPILPDIDAIFDGYAHQEEVAEEEEEAKDYYKELVSLGALKWRKSRATVESPKYSEKVPKFVNVKVNPRPIQQPR